jgi:hypothetical protein
MRSSSSWEKGWVSFSYMILQEASRLRQRRDVWRRLHEVRKGRGGVGVQRSVEREVNIGKVWRRSP